MFSGLPSAGRIIMKVDVKLNIRNDLNLSNPLHTIKHSLVVRLDKKNVST